MPGCASKHDVLELPRIGYTSSVPAIPTKREFLATAGYQRIFTKPTFLQNSNLSLASSLHSSFIKVHYM